MSMNTANRPYASVSGRSDEFNARRGHPLVLRVKVLDPQEESDTTGDLVADDRRLRVAVSLREEDARPRA